MSADPKERAVQCSMSLQAHAKPNRPRWAAETYACMALELPNQERKKGAWGNFYISTDDNSFLIGATSRSRIIRYDGACIWRRIKRHEARLMSLADELKYEVRNNRRRGDRLARVREQACLESRNEINSFIEEKTTELANQAKRMNFERVVLDLSERSWSNGINFPWYRVKQRLIEKLDAYGVPVEMKDENAAEKV
jgi:hypothetical protein